MNYPERRKLPELTGLRGIAALYVMIVHFCDGATAGWPLPIRNLLSSGFVGVNLFFVLSGFVLAWNYIGTSGLTVDRRQFWIARAARILPAYYASLAFALPIFLLMEFRDGLQPGVIGNTLLTSVATLSLTQSWILPWTWAWNNPGWSLSVEAFLYFAFPFFAARDPKKLLRWAALAYVLTAIGSFAFVATHPHPPSWKWDNVPDLCIWISWLGCNPLVHVHEFLMGIGACWLVRREVASGPEAISGPIAVWCAMLVLAALLMGRAASLMPVLMGVYSPLFALLIYGLAKQRGVIAALLRSGPMVYLGEISYSLYLIHGTVGLHLQSYDAGSLPFAKDSAALAGIAAAVSLAMAAVIHTVIEEPYRKALRLRWAS